MLWDRVRVRVGVRVRVRVRVRLGLGVSDVIRSQACWLQVVGVGGWPGKKSIRSNIFRRAPKHLQFIQCSVAEFRVSTRASKHRTAQPCSLCTHHCPSFAAYHMQRTGRAKISQWGWPQGRSRCQKRCQHTAAWLAPCSFVDDALPCTLLVCVEVLEQSGT